jgi:transketolase
MDNSCTEEIHGYNKTRSTDAQLDRLCINTIRTLSMDAVQQARSGHPGTPVALAPLVYTLRGTRTNRSLPFQQ